MDNNNLYGQDGKTQTNFIPNPLPVPQRHSRREMSYDYTICGDKMHYDVELQPGDDFDI